MRVVVVVSACSPFCTISRARPVSLSRFVLDLLLICDGQAANPLPGRGEDRVAERRSEWWHPRFADSARRRIAFHDVHARLHRGDIHARYLEVVEVVLLRPTLAERDLTIKGRAQRHDGCPFHLGT